MTSSKVPEAAVSFWEKSWVDLFPVFEVWWCQALCVFAVYAITVATSGWLLRWIGILSPTTPSVDAPRAADGGRIIGKCENVLCITLVLMGQYEGLGLVLAAKSIARMEQVKQNASYYLGGTLVNVTWSVFWGLVARGLTVGL